MTKGRGMNAERAAKQKAERAGANGSRRRETKGGKRETKCEKDANRMRKSAGAK